MTRLNFSHLLSALLVLPALLNSVHAVNVAPTEAEFKEAIGPGPANSFIFFTGTGNEYVENFEHALQDTLKLPAPRKFTTLRAALEKTSLKSKIPPKVGYDPKYYDAFWPAASKAFAEQATGIVYALIPPGAAEGHYAKYEKPALKLNQHVTGLIEVTSSGPSQGTQKLIKGKQETTQVIKRDTSNDAAELAAANEMTPASGQVPARFRQGTRATPGTKGSSSSRSSSPAPKTNKASSPSRTSTTQKHTRRSSIYRRGRAFRK